MASVELKGSRVLVLGGSGVLGGEIARKLREHEARIALAGRNEEKLRENAVAIGGIVPTIVADLTERDGPRAVVEQALELLEGLDGVVNAAGTVAFGDVAHLEDSVFYELIASNLTGPIRAIREAAMHMDGGFVVSISGLTAEIPTAGMAAYSGAKAALSSMTRALAKELRRKGIHVLDARPPHTETGLVHRALAGQPPKLPKGLDPREVATTIVDGLEKGRRELAAHDFAS